VLSLFSTVLHGLILRALADGPMRLTDLHRKVGGPPQTTLRGHLGNLIGIGALEKQSRDGKANMVDNALTPAGLEMLFVADVLEAWLARAPERAIGLESEAGKAAVRALISGWGSTMLRALAARPFSLTELDNLITAFTYPALERRLSAMHLAGHVVALQQSNGRGRPYAVTEWLRQGVAPLLAASRCERRHLPGETAPLTRIDVEAILLLAMPLVALPPNAHGTCQLTVENGDPKWRAAGVAVEVEGGEIVACTSKLESSPATSSRGSATGWFDALVDGNADRLQAGGDRGLALAMVEGLHSALFHP